MIQPFFNWRTGLAIIAIAIITGTIFYSRFLARKIAKEERQKVAEWVEAGKLLVSDSTGLSDQLVGLIIAENNTIPIIQTLFVPAIAVKPSTITSKVPVAGTE